MRALIFLALRNLLHHRARSIVLVMVLTIVTCVPVLANLVVAQAERALTARAAATPLIYGAQGSEIDLVLSAAYFNGASDRLVPMSDYLAMIDLARHDLVPVRMTTTARGYPLVGVDYEYYRLRGMRLRKGQLPLQIGEVVLGAEVAERLGLGIGDTINTDATQAFDLAGAYPVSLSVTGVLETAATPDDRAVFTDLKTAWIAEGIGHGHQDLDPDRDRDLLLQTENGGVVANAALPTFTRISDENRASFHYHGEEEALPLSAVLVFPRSAKAAALLKGRVADQSETRQIVDVSEVVTRLLERVFQVKSILQNVVAIMGAATLAALGLVVVLSVRMRHREFEIANQIGAPRRHAVWLVLVELVLVLAVAAVMTTVFAILTRFGAPVALQGWLIGG